MTTGSLKQCERADAVEITVVAFISKPVEKFPRVSLRGAGPKHFLPACGRLEQGGSDAKGMLETRSEMAAVDADDDVQFFSRRKFLEEVGEGAAEPVEIGEVVPLNQALDILVHAAAKERDEADGFSLSSRPACQACRMKLMERL